MTMSMNGRRRRTARHERSRGQFARSAADMAIALESSALMSRRGGEIRARATRRRGRRGS